MSHTGVELTRHGATRILARLAHRAALGKNVSPHMLRASSVTNALVAGVPLHIVQAMANHADPKTTHRYYRAANNLDTHAAYTLGQGLSAAISADMSHAS
jgi:site-specific recombinase XerD